MKLPGVLWRPAADLGAVGLGILGATLRLRFQDAALARLIDARVPMIVALWHSHLLIAPYLYRRRFRSLPLRALVSRSRDGDLLARFLARFGIEAVRGSSSRGGASAVRQLARALERGASVLVIPDGPRGPREVAKPGVIALARLSGAPILPAAIAYSRHWQAASWDRLLVPRPFARCVLRIAEPLRVPRDGDPATDRVLAKDLETLLVTLASEARQEAAA
jgi:lysophospholipid acyltransferase (LPLAT)-like uncharacterized protein